MGKNPSRVRAGKKKRRLPNNQRGKPLRKASLKKGETQFLKRGERHAMPKGGGKNGPQPLERWFPCIDKKLWLTSGGNKKVLRENLPKTRGLATKSRRPTTVENHRLRKKKRGSARRG